MAEKKSTKDILAALRAGAAAQPAESATPAAAPEQATPAPAAPAAGAAPVSAGRPLTLKEKLAAARGQAPAGAAPAAAAPAASAPEPAAEKSVGAPAPSIGRPLTLAEKLAAARGSAAPAAGSAPAAAKPAKAAPAPAAAAPARELPPLAEITDPKDLAEALRQAGAKKIEEAKPPAEKKAAAAPKKSADAKVVPGRPSRDAALASGAPAPSRRFVITIPWMAVAWASFTLGLSAFSAMLARFLFPNVLAEPPSTIKVGVPGDFGRGEVSEKWKAEWGFWIVRSDMYNGEDIIYALQSVCTHLGCPPNWLAGEQKFKCPCHGSGFYVSGVNFEGPAPRPLERFKVSIADDGQIIVDKSQKFQEELAQWSDPDSYLPAV
ncbi:MAG: ubiquinol-cytochrome c reductase iron-sulfur subunit [Isosphaeraceae bacterium]|nr:ubiquinol-cytochrome c reductase iron-sulfur subunit [Isosphaeraceae bacterium]